MDRIVKECAETILNETASVKRLVNEFAQFSRLPSAKLVPSGLNDMVRAGLAVFEDRLEGIEVEVDLADDIPQVMADPEQFKRVVVNLVDNAAEAMQDEVVKRLFIRTRMQEGDIAEIVFSDSGCGITARPEGKLFLPTSRRRVAAQVWASPL
jgi:nitrogen fixation/metabolism regulation signal transduction histidine kinase